MYECIVFLLLFHHKNGNMKILIWKQCLTIIQFGFPTAHKLTFLSSPPVTNTLPDLCPRETQFTLAPWATNSSEIRKWYGSQLIDVKPLITNITFGFTNYYWYKALILTQLPGPFRNTWRICHFSVKSDSTLDRLKLFICIFCW